MKNFLTIAAALMTFASASAQPPICNNDQAGMESMNIYGRSDTAVEERVPENRVIYEVFVRNFSQQGNLKGVEAQIPRLKELGVDVVWLMPIYPTGLEGRWGKYGSPYAVRDYKAIDPDYGTEADLRSLVEAIHGAGMEIWLDWVANHTAVDHPWTKSHLEYYGGSLNHPHGWNDVYQLDYSNQALRSEMIDALKYWVREFDIDGYRCDYADGVPRDFWRQARRDVDAVKPIAWMAESGGDGDNALLVTETFDYNYAWRFNDQLIEFGTGDDVSILNQAVRNLWYPSDAKRYEGKSRMVYLSNHDVVQDKGGTEPRHFGANLRPMTVLLFTVYGMPLLYNGQEVAYNTGGVSLAEKTPVNWNGDASMTELIKALTALKHSHPALRTGTQAGEFTQLSTTDRKVFAFRRSYNGDNVTVLLNFSDAPATFTVTGQLPQGTHHDIFTGTTADFSSSRTFTLPAKGYAVYVAGEGDGPVIGPSDPVEAYSLYIDNRSGWNPLYIYAWTDNGAWEPFGKWPGKSADETVTASDGNTYQRFSLTADCTGAEFSLIPTDYRGNQFDLATVLFDRDRFFRIDSRSGQEIFGVSTSGINCTDAEVSVAAEYYTLDGQRTNAPTPGDVYILRRCGQTTKILLP